MTDRMVSEYIDLGVIKIVQAEGEFPWGIFVGGEINCAYGFDIKNCSINDMRVWVNEHAAGTVYLQYGKWTPCRFAFTNPDDAIQFSIKFGDILTRIK